MEELTKTGIILLAVLPALIVVGTVAMILLLQQRKTLQESKTERLVSRNKQVLPVVFTAYERAILFLERIRPQNLVPNAESLQDTAKHLQIELVYNIREEYEHNLSQQLYINQEAWNFLVQAKEQVITLINLSANQVEENAPAMELGKVILEKVSVSEELVVQKAILLLKKDFGRFIPDFNDA